MRSALQRTAGLAAQVAAAGERRVNVAARGLRRQVASMSTVAVDAYPFFELSSEGDKPKTLHLPRDEFYERHVGLLNPEYIAGFRSPLKLVRHRKLIEEFCDMLSSDDGPTVEGVGDFINGTAILPEHRILAHAKGLEDHVPTIDRIFAVTPIMVIQSYIKYLNYLKNPNDLIVMFEMALNEPNLSKDETNIILGHILLASRLIAKKDTILTGAQSMYFREYVENRLGSERFEKVKTIDMGLIAAYHELGRNDPEYSWHYDSDPSSWLKVFEDIQREFCKKYQLRELVYVLPYIPISSLIVFENCHEMLPHFRSLGFDPLDIANDLRIEVEYFYNYILYDRRDPSKTKELWQSLMDQGILTQGNLDEALVCSLWTGGKDYPQLLIDLGANPYMSPRRDISTIKYVRGLPNAFELEPMLLGSSEDLRYYEGPRLRNITYDEKAVREICGEVEEQSQCKGRGG